MNNQFGMNQNPQFGPNPPYIGVRRSGVMVIVFTLITCGIYWFYWLYQAMEDINRMTGEQRINSTGLLIGSILCFPIAFLVLYKLDQELARLAPAEGTHYKENFTMWLLLVLLMGLGTYVAMYQITEAFGQIWDRRSGIAPPPFPPHQ